MPAIKVVNNATAAAVTTANNAFSKANTALKEIEETAIVKVVKEVDAGNMAYMSLSFQNKNGVEKANSGSIASTNHSHRLIVSQNDKGIVKFHPGKTEAFDAGTELTINYAAAVINLSGNATTGKLSWTTYGGDDGNFNIADTPFYKKAAFSSVAEGSGGKKITFTMSEAWSGETREGLSRTIDLNILAIDGTILKTAHVVTDGIDAYDIGNTAGYTAGETAGYNSGYTAGETAGKAIGYKNGWAAAIATLTFISSGNTVTAKVGNDESGSNSKSLTANLGVKNDDYTRSTLKVNGTTITDSGTTYLDGKPIVYRKSSHNRGTAYITKWT